MPTHTPLSEKSLEHTVLPFPMAAPVDAKGVATGLFQTSPEADCSAGLDELRHALGGFLDQPGETERWMKLLMVRRLTAAKIARLPRKNREHSLVHEIHALVREMARSGVHDHAADPNDLAEAEKMMRKSWPGLLAAMLLVPAWQCQAAPLLMEVPDWLRADYVRWLFEAPQHFPVAGHARTYAAFTLQRLEELVRWVKRAPDEREEMKVLGAYASHCSLLPLYFEVGALRHHAELRGRLLGRALGLRGDKFSVRAEVRTGRRLRIGIVHRHFAPQPETYAILPLFEHLDPNRFEVMLFSYVNDFSRMEDYCRQKAAELLVLPADLKDQLALLRNAALDVVVFSANVTAECNVVTRLALHRVAPLQVVNHSSCVTTGLPEIDLYLTGEKAVSAGDRAHFGERLGLMPGPSHTFNFSADGEEARSACTRADFDLPEDVFVFVTTVNYRAITPEMQRTWARLLAAVPGSRLLVHPFHPTQPPGPAIHRFNASFEEALKLEGVDASRLALSSVVFEARTDLKSLVSLGDVYLDSNHCSAVESLIDPLELGLPVVTWEGEALRSRTGASLLRVLAMDGLVANNAADYQAVAVRLATDSVYRKKYRTLIQAHMQEAPLFLNPSKASEGFGKLIEAAFDELVAQGPVAFRENPEPVTVDGRA